MDGSDGERALSAEGAQGDAQRTTRERQRRALGYAQRQQQFRARAEALRPRSQRLLNWSGLAFAAAAAAFLSTLADLTSAAALWGSAVGLFAFGVLFAAHARTERAEQEAWRWCKVNAAAEARALDAWRELPEDGSEFVDPAHPHSSDLDLFGPGSLFQFINVAHTAHGQRALATLLSQPAPLAEARARQQAVRCLVPELELRQRLETLTLHAPAAPAKARPTWRRSTPSGAPTAAAGTESVLAWAESPPRFSSRPPLVWAAWLLPLSTLLAFVLSQTLHAPAWLWKGAILLQAWLVFRTRRDAGAVSAIVAPWQGAFERLARAFHAVEHLRLDAPLLERLRRELLDESRDASLELARLDRILGWFALRNSEWAHPPINTLLSWDVHCVVALERWQNGSGRRLRKWLEALGQIEALSSLAGAAYDNPEYTFPEFIEGPAQLSAAGLGHALLGPGVRVHNDVCLPAPGRALLVTGSNMSGKSTLLRAMGLATVMAFAGGPVCARSLRLSTVSVYTSLRVTDSLADGVSRFYAELARLRSMLAAVRDGGPVLFLIDEILVGTNSVERGIGARWLLAEFLRAGAIGAVSTHDADLCQLPADLMARVEQAHFREDVDDGTLVFDYRLRAGPVKAGNALRLMRSLGLAVPDP
jgi:hypothetical protein